MALESTEGVVLKSFNWSESSRTVVLLTSRFGKLPLIDRAGRKIASKRGRVIPFARLKLTFYQGKNESSGYISDCELLRLFEMEGEGSLGRIAYASAVCELLYSLLPDEESNSGLYQYLVTYLETNTRVSRTSLTAAFLVFLLRLMSFLGYRPSLSFCSSCSKPLEEVLAKSKSLVSSAERGGLICHSCKSAGESYIHVSVDSARKLAWLQRASLSEAAEVTIRYEQTAELLDVLIGFLKYHSGISGEIKSLEFLNKLKKSQWQT